MDQARQGVATKTIMDSFDQSIAYPGKSFNRWRGEETNRPN